MFKKEKFKKLDKKYKNHAYEGLMGFFMKYCHKNLENYDFPKDISKVLLVALPVDSTQVSTYKTALFEYHPIAT